MKTLVIHPDDDTTNFLKEIYLDKNWTVINKNISKKILKNQIKIHDRIIMLGHGNEFGLFGYNKFVIDSSLIYLLKEKECICIWCNANLFVNKYKLKGFYTGMIISEPNELLDYPIKINDNNDLLNSNLLFSDAVKRSIDTKDVISNLNEIYNNDNPIVIFNRKNLYYNNY